MNLYKRPLKILYIDKDTKLSTDELKCTYDRIEFHGDVSLTLLNSMVMFLFGTEPEIVVFGRIIPLSDKINKKDLLESNKKEEI